MLEVLNLRKAFGKNIAVKDVHFLVERGEIHGLIGPNGSGKTTTFNMLSGFMPPTKGDIRFNGMQVAGMAAHRVARLGLVRTFQLTSVYQELSVAENVSIAHYMAVKSGKVQNRDDVVEKNVDEILEFMGLSAFRTKMAGVLPAGSQRLLSVASAIAAQPSLLMLDEPLAGLNPTEKSVIVGKIRELRDRGLTVLMIEHDLKSIMTICDRITVINFGEVIGDGTPAQISQNEAVIDAYIGGGKHHA